MIDRGYTVAPIMHLHEDNAGSTYVLVWIFFYKKNLNQLQLSITQVY